MKPGKSEEEQAIEMTKTYLMFQRFQPILESVVKKYGNFEKLDDLVSECHAFIGRATDVVHFNLILYGLKTESQMQQIIKKVPHTNSRQLYLDTLPSVISLMEKFLNRVTLLSPKDDVDVSSKIDHWKTFTRNSLTQPLSSSGASCFQLTNLIEHNTELFTLYLRGIQEAPQAVLEETALLVVKSIPQLFDVNAEHEKVFHRIEKELIALPMNVPDAEVEKRDLKIYEMELPPEKTGYAKFIEKGMGAMRKASSNAMGYLRKKSESPPETPPSF